VITLPFLNHAYVNVDASGEVADTDNVIFMPAQTAVLFEIELIIGQACATIICEIPNDSRTINSLITFLFFIEKFFINYV
jgi:hypothetical protein